MSVLALGLLFGAVTLVVMFSGMPIAFSLGFVALVFMAGFMPASSLDTVTQNVYEEMASITLLSIPLFILKGAAIGRSDAGRDLYLAMHAWMQRIPGGLGIANVFTCALFAAMAGSSPATCSAIGSAGIPEMRKRGYSPGFAAGIIAAGGTLGILLPPSITMILYAVAAEVSLGRLFLAGIGPGLLLVALFALYAAYRYRPSPARAFGTAVLRRAMARRLDRPFGDATSGMYAVNDRALPLLARPYETGAPEVEALLRVSEAGLTLEEVPVDMRERAGGESKLRGKKAVKLVLTVAGALLLGGGLLARRKN